MDVLLYHGTNHSRIEPNPVYNYQRCGSGLGFYWTNRKEDASRYGNRIFSRVVNLSKLVRPDSPKFSRSQIESWLRAVQRTDEGLYLTVLSNWDEDLLKAFVKLVNAIMNSDDAVEQVLQFQSELMLRDTKKWCDIAKACQIKGIEVGAPYDGKADDSGLRHYVLYEAG